MSRNVMAGFVDCLQQAKAATVVIELNSFQAPIDARLVYLEGGQSNSNGAQFNTNASLSYSYINTNTYYKNSGFASTANNGSLQTFQIGTNHNNEQNLRPDPSIYVARDVEALEPTTPLTVIQTADGGTGFRGGTGEWSSTGVLRNALENHYINPGLASLQNTTSDEIWLMPYFWIQGETDASNTAWGNVYQTQLTQFIADVRAWVQIPDYPIVIARLANFSTRVAAPQVRAAQDAIAAADPNVYLINPSSFSYQSDDTHFTDAGYEQLAAAYVALAQTIGARKWPGDSSVVINTPISAVASSPDIVVSVEADEYATLYAAAYSSGSPAPSAADVIGGAGAGFVAGATTNLVYDQANSATISGITSPATYDVYAVVEDIAGNLTPVFSQTISN